MSDENDCVNEGYRLSRVVGRERSTGDGLVSVWSGGTAKTSRLASPGLEPFELVERWQEERKKSSMGSEFAEERNNEPGSISALEASPFDCSGLFPIAESLIPAIPFFSLSFKSRFIRRLRPELSFRFYKQWTMMH